MKPKDPLLPTLAEELAELDRKDKARRKRHKTTRHAVKSILAVVCAFWG